MSEPLGGGFDRSLRAWEPEEGEVTTRNAGKPFRAFKIYRDLGPERTLKAAAGGYFNTPLEVLTESQYGQIKKWSAKYEWRDRVQAFDDHYEMRDRAAIENFQATKSNEFAERQVTVKEKMLEASEKAADQMIKMLEWPLTEQRVLRTGEDGEEVTYVFSPAGWNKGTVATMYNIAAGAITGRWSTVKPGQGDVAEDEWDFSNMTDDEVNDYVRLSEKVGIARKERNPEKSQ